MEPTKKRPSTDLFFAFPDGVLDYSCLECNGLCCYDHSLTDNIRKGLSTLFKLYPAFGSAVMGIDGTVIQLCTPGGCFFLDDDNLCRIEKEHGKAYKLDTCRTFPFNYFTQIKNIIVVGPNYLCPLQLKLPAQPGTVAGTHQELRHDVLNSGLLEGKTTLSTFHVSETSDEFLRRERHFRDLCSEGLGKRPFRDTLEGMIEDKRELKNFLTRALAVLGIKETPQASGIDHTDNLLHTLSPTLRISMHRLSSEGRIRALALYELILRRLSLLRQGPETLTGANGIYRALAPALRLLAGYTDPLPVPPPSGKNVDLPPKLKYGPIVLVAYAAVVHGRKGKTTMEALELAIEPDLSPALRSAFLGVFGRWIEALQAKSDPPKQH